MRRIDVKGTALAVHDQGQGPALVLLHDIGQDHSIWTGILPAFDSNRIIACDLRGHGASDRPKGPYTMGGLISDVEGVCDQLNLKDTCVIGLGLGGMIAQGLAVKRLDLVRALVLIASAAKFGQPGPWMAKAHAARQAPIPDEGYAASCEAIAGTDFYTPTSGLRLPTLGLCGDRDATTPPDLVRETTDLIPGSVFHLIRKAGHDAPATHPKEVAHHIATFLKSIGHL